MAIDGLKQAMDAYDIATNTEFSMMEVVNSLYYEEVSEFQPQSMEFFDITIQPISSNLKQRQRDARKNLRRAHLSRYWAYYNKDKARQLLQTIYNKMKAIHDQM